MSRKGRTSTVRAATSSVDSQQSDAPRPSAEQALAILLFTSVVLVFFAWQPLWHTDLWGHLAYGRWMSEHQSIPTAEPFLPWEADEQFVDMAWLSQWFGYATYRSMGVGGVQFLYAGGIALAAGILAYTLLQKSGSALCAIFGAFVFLIVDWEQLRIVRPQIAGLACYSALLSIILRTPRPYEPLLVAALFALWANLHGSFVIGWVAIIAALVGKALPVLIGSRSGRGVTVDSELGRFAILLGTAVIVTLFNPYGPRLHVEVARVTSHLNLRDLIEWKPIFEHPRQLTAFAVAGVVATAAFGLSFARNMSKRRVTLGEASIFIVCAGATLVSSRMILWWGPIAGWIIAMAGASWWNFGARSAKHEPMHHRQNWKPKAIGAVILLAAIACTPAGFATMTGRAQSLQNVVSAQTPIGAAEYLRESPPRGVIFNPMEWGDYLAWAGPEGLQIFANSHAHLIPAEIWREYMRTIAGGADAIAILDRHNVEVVVADPDRQSALVETLRANDEWKQSYEDDRSIVFEKR